MQPARAAGLARHPELLQQVVSRPEPHVRARPVRRRVGRAERPHTLVSGLQTQAVEPGAERRVGDGVEKRGRDV